MKRKLTTSAVATLLLATNLYSQELSEISILSSSLKTTEKTATYSTEIYQKKDIENSKSKDLYEFLNSQTSLNISPNYGNTFSQKIDLRGYGIGDGYQNIVITVDGRRLNNIDMSTQLLSAIPIESVDKIEIIKGTGSVELGDNANAGAINIITNGKNSNYIKTNVGSNNFKSTSLSLGFNTSNFIINGYLDETTNDGDRVLSNGNTNNNYNKNKEINFTYFPTDKLELKLNRNYSDMNIKYGGKLTLDEYKENPNQASAFTEQFFRSYVTSINTNYLISNDYKIDLSFSDEDKLSKYSSGWKSEYDYQNFSSKIVVDKEGYNAVIGIDGFKGEREGSTNITSKSNLGTFLSTKLHLNKDTYFNIGGRVESVNYKYKPTTGTKLNDDLKLYAFDLGVNRSINTNSSYYLNYNKSFQAPDIDRFFDSGNFNGFISPAKVNNYSIGYFLKSKQNSLKTSIFYVDLDNEIYYYTNGGTSYNTNIDQSHKYGFEIINKYSFNDNFITSINYSYIVAKIDKENENNGAYNGKNLPGVSNHNITLNLAYELNNFKTILSHTFRSETYAANDFENNFSQKQEAYHSTDVNISYSKKDFEFYIKIQNLLDQKNALWIKDDNIYPVNFERKFYTGVKYKF